MPTNKPKTVSAKSALGIRRRRHVHRAATSAAAIQARRKARQEADSLQAVIPDFDIAARTRNIIEFFGSQSVVAEIFGVHRGQPGRWATAQENPSVENRLLVIGVESVTQLAKTVWTHDVALDWMKGSNSYLDGARPIDVLKLEGPTRVEESLRAALEGAYS